MSSMQAVLEGLRRMSRAPGLVLMIWAANLVIAAPLAVFMLESIHGFTAGSNFHRTLAEGFDTGWYAEFSSSGALEETLSPSQVGIGAWLTNLDRWWDGRVFLHHPVVLASGLVFVLLWLLLLGGVIEALREGAPRPRLATVVADGMRFFPRLLRLSVVTALGYYLVFRFARWAFPKIHELTAELTREWQVLCYNLAGAIVVSTLIVLIRLISDYAKIALVLERQNSSLRAMVRGVRFVAFNPSTTLAIAALYGALLAVVFGIYSVAAPGVGESTPGLILVAFGISQLFLIFKQALRLAFLGSETAYYELNG